MSPRNKRQFIAVIIFLVIGLAFSLTYRMGVVHGDSMMPTYKDGEIVLVNKLYKMTGKLANGDVILVHVNNDVLIKRVEYLPGDYIEYPVSAAFLSVREFFEVETLPGELPGTGRFRLKVPPGFVVVIGDNLKVSEDSRIFGPVALEEILGKVVAARPRKKP
ncbi:MAG: signal peptidase I [Chthonomonadales bacterium]